MKKPLMTDNFKIFAFCLLLLSFAFFNLDIMNALSKTVMISLKLNAAELANISSYGFYANLVSLLFFGSLLDKFNLIKITKFILLITVIAIVMFSLFLDLPTFIFYRCITGFLVGVAFPACMRVIALKAPQKAGFITGLYGLAAMGGGIIAQNPVVTSLHFFGLRGLFWIISFWGIIIFFIPSKLLKPPTDKLLSKQYYRYPILIAVRNRHNWFAAIHVSLLNLPIFVLGDLWSNLYLTQKHAISENLAALTTSMIFLGHIIGSILLGLYSDKTQIRKPIMIGGVIIAIASLVLISNVANASWLIILFLLLGIGSGAQVIGFSYVAISNSTFAAASATTILSFVSVFFGAVFQQISGHILEHNKLAGTITYSVNAYNKIIFVLLVCLSISFVAALLIRTKNFKIITPQFSFQE